MAYFMEREFTVNAAQLGDRLWTLIVEHLQDWATKGGKQGLADFNRFKIFTQQKLKYGEPSSKQVVSVSVDLQFLIPEAQLSKFPEVVKWLRLTFTSQMAASGTFNRGVSNNPIIAVKISPLSKMNKLVKKPVEVIDTPAYRSVFVHEYTHFLDWARREKHFDAEPTPKVPDTLTGPKGKKLTPREIANIKYFSAPVELLAYASQIGAEIVSRLNRRGELDELKKGGPAAFVQQVDDDYSLKRFMTPDARKKFIKYLVQFWNKHPELGGLKL